MTDKVTDHPFDFEITSYVMEDLLIHKVGDPSSDGAAVQWNIIYKKQEIVQDGLVYTANVPVLNSNPYISLVDIAFDSDKEPYMYKSRPMEGGADSGYARRIGQELIMAADYCDWLESQE